MRVALSVFVVITLSIVSLIPATPATSDERYSWSDVKRVVAFADIHGSFEDLTQLLRAVDVVDKDLHWKAGATHLVSLGDVLDRGPDSRKAMDLLIALQHEANAAGGALHVVLGNHEAMNLMGDLRYVTVTEFAAYADDEPKGLRERIRNEWVTQYGPNSGAQFDARFPHGYFGHRALFSRTGKYGSWLLNLPVAIAIDDTLFMHAGPSQVLSGVSLVEINRRYRAALAEYLQLFESLQSAGVVREEDAFEQRAALAQKREQGLADPSRDRIAEDVRRFVAADRQSLLSPDGPNWYRGPALCNEAAERDVLEPLLDGLHVRRLVIGHTVTRNQRVVTRFEGKVIKLDTGMNRSVYRGHPAALILESGNARAVYVDATQAVPVAPEGLFVAPNTLDDSSAASILANGTVSVGSARAPGMFDVTVEFETRRIPALFVQARGDNVRLELAAHGVDRALNLGLVPATVRRQVNGQDGYLQARPARWFTQADVEAQSLRFGGWCALAPQFELMYTFDALIGNEGRTRDRILYDSEWSVLLTAHDRAFGTKVDFPAQLKSRPPQPGSEMRRRLAALDPKLLERAVAEQLNEKEREALLKRRDSLLAGKASRAAAR